MVGQTDVAHKLVKLVIRLVESQTLKVTWSPTNKTTKPAQREATLSSSQMCNVQPLWLANWSDCGRDLSFCWSILCKV